MKIQPFSIKPDIKDLQKCKSLPLFSPTFILWIEKYSESELCQPILAQDLWMMDHLQMKARALMVILLGIARHHILEGNREIAEPFDQALSLTFCSPSNKKCSGKMSDS